MELMIMPVKTPVQGMSAVLASRKKWPKSSLGLAQGWPLASKDWYSSSATALEYLSKISGMPPTSEKAAARKGRDASFFVNDKNVLVLTHS